MGPLMDFLIFGVGAAFILGVLFARARRKWLAMKEEEREREENFVRETLEDL